VDTKSVVLPSTRIAGFPPSAFGTSVAARQATATSPATVAPGQPGRNDSVAGRDAVSALEARA